MLFTRFETIFVLIFSSNFPEFLYPMCYKPCFILLKQLMHVTDLFHSSFFIITCILLMLSTTFTRFSCYFSQATLVDFCAEHCFIPDVRLHAEYRLLALNIFTK